MSCYRLTIYKVSIHLANSDIINVAKLIISIRAKLNNNKAICWRCICRFHNTHSIFIVRNHQFTI